MNKNALKTKVVLLALQQSNLEYLDEIKSKSFASTVRMVLTWFFSTRKKVKAMRIDDVAAVHRTLRLSTEHAQKLDTIRLFSTSYTLNSIINMARLEGYDGQQIK